MDIGNIYAGDRKAIRRLYRPGKKTLVELRAPNGALIVGTYEKLMARAGATMCEVLEDGTLEPQWDGHVNIFWDTQKTVYENNQRVWLDENGDEWRENELVVVPIGDGDRSSGVDNESA